jgi:hypothetical protein
MIEADGGGDDVRENPDHLDILTNMFYIAIDLQ